MLNSRGKVQIACLGASTVYGVGGTKGGWPELLKYELHQKMYVPDGIGEYYEVYNFGIPGSTLSGLHDQTETNLKSIRKRGRQFISIFHGGANNALAIGSRDNFVSTPEKFRHEVTSYLEMVQSLSDHVLCLGMMPMNQNKVMPKIKNDEAQTKIYFSNERIKEFETIIGEVAQSLKITFIALFDEGMSLGWSESYQYDDGIHPNDQGHAWLYQKVKAKLQKIVEL